MFQKFYKDLKNTFYNPLFYSNIDKIGLSHPFWIFVKLSFVSAFVVILALLPGALTFVDEVREAAENEYFPSELEIVIEDGIATSNLTEVPYYVTSEIFDPSQLEDEQVNVIMVNTNEDLTLAEIEQDESFFFMTKSSFVFKDAEELRVFKYSEIFENKLTINQENVEGVVNSVVEKLPVILIMLALFGYVFLIVANPIAWIVITFILSLIALVINKVRNLGFTYKNVFKLSMYAMVPTIVIDIVTDLFFGLDSFSFLLTTTIFTIVLIWNTKPKEIILAKIVE